MCICTLYTHYSYILFICVVYPSAIGHTLHFFHHSFSLLTSYSRMFYVARQSSSSLYSSIESHRVATHSLSAQSLRETCQDAHHHHQNQVPCSHEPCCTVGFPCFCRCRCCLEDLPPQREITGSKTKFI